MYACLLILSLPEIYQRYKEASSEDFEHLLQSESVPPICIIAPAYNEAKTIVTSTHSMLRLSYPHIEVIIVNDGSTDQTLEELISAYEMKVVAPALPVTIKTQEVKAFYRSDKHPNLLVIDKNNGGKADSLNAGINACTTPFFMALDADTIIEQDALKRMIRPILTQKNAIASGGTIRIVNDCQVEYGRVTKVLFPKTILPSIQVVEYLRAFLFGRLGWNQLGGNLIISGAFGLFDKRAVLEVGGYCTDTVGEDMELTIRLHRHMRRQKTPYHIEFIPDPVAWTEVPKDLKTLARQRERWHRGLIDSLWRHRGMLFNPRYGIIGCLSFPFFVFGEMLAPVIEVIGYIFTALGLYFGVVDTEFAILLFMTAWGFSSILTVFSILMEESTFRRYNSVNDLIKMFIYSIVESLGYRQLTVIWRIQAFWSFLMGNKSWGRMSRSGFTTE